MTSDEKARLLYLQPSSTFGGAERQASIAVPLLSKLGFDVTVMVGPSTSGIDWLREYGADDLIHTPSFPGGWSKPRGLGRLALPGRYLRCVRRVAAEVQSVARARKADIIYAAMAFSWVGRRRWRASWGFRSSGVRVEQRAVRWSASRCARGRR